MPTSSIAIASRAQETRADEDARPYWAAIVAAIAGLLAGWLAAGSFGLLAHALRHSLTWLAMGVAVVMLWPAVAVGRRWRKRGVVVLGAIAAVVMTRSMLPAVNVLGVAVLLGALAWVHVGRTRAVMSMIATAVTVLGLYRFAYASIPLIWYFGDFLGGLFGRLGGLLALRPLRVGATYGGADYLITMFALLGVAWCIVPPASRRGRRMIIALVAIVMAHLTYLMVLAALTPALAQGPYIPPPNLLPGQSPPWTWSDALHTLVPWNVPALAALLHAIVAVYVIRIATNAHPDDTVDVRESLRTFAARPVLVALTIALLLPIISTLTLGRCDLKGKKIVFYEKGFLNWLKPKHGEYGRLGIGMYGMMPQYLESLGGTAVISPTLSEEDLRGADAVVLLFPNEAWKDGQLERLWKFAHDDGKTLMVVGEHSAKEKDVPWDRGGNRYNEALLPTRMRVAFDAAEFAIGGWLQSYQPMAHPATAGVEDYRNEFGVVIGASLETRWPASPILIGTHGWNDQGDEKSDRAMLGDNKYNSGERIGDAVLVAEQPFGRGRVVAFGDTSSFTNGITIGSYAFTSRLFAYIASQPGSPQAIWRQFLGVIGAALLVWLIVSNAKLRQPAAITVTAAVLALCIVLCNDANARASLILPDGRAHTPNALAYIDTSHLSAANEESWRPDGTMGLAMTFLRDGYLVLNLRDFDYQRIHRAGIVATVAPDRPFSGSEIQAVRDYVEDGGIFILTSGYERRLGSESLMKEFGFAFGEAGDRRAAAPWGHFKSPYLDHGGGVYAYVRFNAGWPIYCTDPAARVIAYGPGNKPAILMRTMGRGKFVMVGDTGFAMNKNLEWEGGQPFEGMRENADFWRWFLTVLTDQPQQWVPPPATQPATMATTRPTTPTTMATSATQPATKAEAAQ